MTKCNCIISVIIAALVLYCCRIQAAQAAATPATTLTSPPDVQSSVTEEAPPLPPLPPEEEAQPPPPPPGPPSAPAPPPLPTAQTLFQSASRSAPPSHQFSNQQLTQHQVVSSNAHPSQSFGSSASGFNGLGSRVSAIQVKTEGGAGTIFDTNAVSVKTEPAGTTGRQKEMGSGQQQAQQPGGAIQFGLGGAGKPAGKVIVYCHLIITSWQTQ